MKGVRLLAVTIVCITVLMANPLAYAAESTGPRPTWKVGDSWTVKTWYPRGSKRARVGVPRTYVRKGREVLVSFSVAGVKEIEGHSCYEVEVVYPPDGVGLRRRYVLLFRVDTVRLVQITDQSVGNRGSVKDSVQRFPVDGRGPILVPYGYSSAVPFHFPDLLSGDSECIGIDDYVRRQAVTTRSGKDAEGKVHTEYEYVLTRVNKDGEHEAKKAVITWVEGEPWWRHAVKYRNISRERRSEYVSEAELVEFTIGGERHVVKPKQDDE